MEENGTPEPQSNGELRTDSVSQVYAEALMEMAEATGELQSIADEVEELGELLRTQPGLLKLLASGMLGRDERRELIQRVFQEQVSDVLYRFLQVVNDKDRLESLRGIVKAFGEQMAEHHGIVEADVWAPQKLDEDQLDRISETLARQIGAQRVVVHQYEDPSLIGGLKIRIGDTLIDASVAAKLRQLRRRMLDAGRAKAREQSAVEEA